MSTDSEVDYLAKHAELRDSGRWRINRSTSSGKVSYHLVGHPNAKLPLEAAYEVETILKKWSE